MLASNTFDTILDAIIKMVAVLDNLSIILTSTTKFTEPHNL